MSDRQRDLTIRRLLFAGLALPLWPAALSAAPSHTDEIQAYVVITAMAQTVSDRCDDILVNNNMIVQALGYFHLAPEDEHVVRLAHGLEMQRLDATIKAAPSVKAWCDEAYRTYGPNGDATQELASATKRFVSWMLVTGAPPNCGGPRIPRGISSRRHQPQATRTDGVI